MNQSLLTPAELGRVLGGVPVKTVMEWRRQYQWPHVKIGRKFFWTPEQVEQITRTHTVVAGKAVPTDGRTARSRRRS